MKDGQVRHLVDNKGVTTYKQIGDTTYVSRYSNKSVGFSGLFRIVLIILLLIAIMRVTLGSHQIVTFTGFLEALSTAPTIQTAWLKEFVAWGDSLTSIPIIGAGLAFLSKIVSVALFGATGVLQIMTYVFWITGYLFA